MKVMSFNIKHLIFEDLFGLWRKRYEKAKNYIKKEQPGILGVQELTRKGKKYFTKNLQDYQIIGKRRHSIIFTNEYNCMLIKKNIKILSHNTFSLSDKINVLGRKTKSDKFPRICVVAHVLINDKKYMIVNTHMDNSDYKNKKRLLKIYNNILASQKKEDELVILTGDFNMTRKNNNLEEFAKDYNDPLKDDKTPTFIGKEEKMSLDYIFLDKRLSYKNAKVHSDSNDNGYISDHHPISCEVEV